MRNIVLYSVLPIWQNIDILNRDIRISTLTIYNPFSHDTLTLYDGKSEASPLLAQHCGKSIPPTYYSQTNMAFIHFQTDGSVMGTGFELEYTPSSKLYLIRISISFYS